LLSKARSGSDERGCAPGDRDLGVLSPGDDEDPGPPAIGPRFASTMPMLERIAHYLLAALGEFPEGVKADEPERKVA
jgi:hypothetical protein